jgi:hypothetical protein
MYSEHFIWMVVYMIAQSVLAIVYLVFSIVSGINFEGWTNWERASTLGGSLTSFWQATTIIESSLWTLTGMAAITCVALMARVCHIVLVVLISLNAH